MERYPFTYQVVATLGTVMLTLIIMMLRGTVALLKLIFRKKPVVEVKTGVTTFTFYCGSCYRTFTCRCFYGRKVKCYGCGNILDVPVS